jgi:hypothetical protein
MRAETVSPKGQGEVVRITPDATPGVQPGATLFQGPETAAQPERSVTISPFEQARQIGILVENGHDYAITSHDFPDIPPDALEERVFDATSSRILKLEVMQRDADDPLLKRQIEGQIGRLRQTRDRRLSAALESMGIQPANSVNRVGLASKK